MHPVYRKALGGTVMGCGLVLGAMLAQAELAPAVYKQMQDQAPEVLRILAHSVDISEVTRAYGSPGTKISGTKITTNVQIRALVEGVGRTATALKSGDIITVRYTVITYEPGPPPPGPHSAPILKPGEKARAFLKKEGDAYVLAALGESLLRE